MKKIFLAAGGTGGHLFPAIALGEELIDRGHKVHLITDLRCQRYLSSDLEIIPHIIDVRINTHSLLTKILSLKSLVSATFSAIMLLGRERPAIMIGFGGYPAAPALLAALLLKIPIVLYEPNCSIGKTNQRFLIFAKKIALAYPEAIKYCGNNKDKALITGNLVRKAIQNLEVKKQFDNEVFRIFVFGGSQGARIFSTLVPESIRILKDMYPELRLAITQQASQEWHKDISTVYNNLDIPCQLAEFFHDMPARYQEADLAIARSGASTLAELVTIGLPAILIPYPYSAGQHQYYNAKALADSGASWCLEQRTVTPEKLALQISELICNRQLLQKASANLLKRKKEGNKTLAATVEKIIN